MFSWILKHCRSAGNSFRSVSWWLVRTAGFNVLAVTWRKWILRLPAARRRCRLVAPGAAKVSASRSPRRRASGCSCSSTWTMWWIWADSVSIWRTVSSASRRNRFRPDQRARLPHHRPTFTAIRCPAQSAHATCTAAISSSASSSRPTFQDFTPGLSNVSKSICKFMQIFLWFYKFNF